LSRYILFVHVLHLSSVDFNSEKTLFRDERQVYLGQAGAKKTGRVVQIIVLDIAKHGNLAQYNHLLCYRQGTSGGLMVEVARSPMITKVYVSLLNAIRTR
jgi:hypothetical protein